MELIGTGIGRPMHSRVELSRREESRAEKGMDCTLRPAMVDSSFAALSPLRDLFASWVRVSSRNPLSLLSLPIELRLSALTNTVSNSLLLPLGLYMERAVLDSCAPPSLPRSASIAAEAVDPTLRLELTTSEHEETELVEPCLELLSDRFLSSGRYSFLSFIRLSDLDLLSLHLEFEDFSEMLLVGSMTWLLVSTSNGVMPKSHTFRAIGKASQI